MRWQKSTRKQLWGGLEEEAARRNMGCKLGLRRDGRVCYNQQAYIWHTSVRNTLIIQFLLQIVEGEIYLIEIYCTHQCAMRASSQPFSPDPTPRNGRHECCGHGTKVFSPNPIHAEKTKQIISNQDNNIHSYMNCLPPGTVSGLLLWAFQRTVSYYYIRCLRNCLQNWG